MAWTDIGNVDPGDFIKASFGDDTRANFLHVAAADGTLNQTGLGAQVATTLLNGFMSSTDKTKLNGLSVQLRYGSYTGTGANLNVTVSSGDEIKALIVIGAYSASDNAVWIKIGSSLTMVMIDTNVIRNDGAFTLNNGSNGIFLAPASASVNTETYYYIAFF